MPRPSKKAHAAGKPVAVGGVPIGPRSLRQLARCASKLRSWPTALAALLPMLAVLSTAGGADGDSNTSGHWRIENPLLLTPAAAETLYGRVVDSLASAYARSDEPAALDYRKWRRLNSAPYLSATHGNRYVNNYANARAVGYGNLKAGEKLPAGASIAKDSLTVTSGGEAYGAALFIMEKLNPGTRPENGDWRYVMILPDGSYIGDSEGDGAAEVAYCHACHKARAATDFLFQVPPRYRRQP